MVDSSGSINERDPRNYDRVKSFLKGIVDGLNIGQDDSRVALVLFGNKGQLEFNLGTYYDSNAIKSAIDRMPYREQNTNTSGGLYIMMSEVFNYTSNDVGGVSLSGDRGNVENRAIVITDGVSTRDASKTTPYAEEAHRKGIEIVAVGVTDKVKCFSCHSIP